MLIKPEKHHRSSTQSHLFHPNFLNYQTRIKLHPYLTNRPIVPLPNKKNDASAINLFIETGNNTLETRKTEGTFSTKAKNQLLTHLKLQLPPEGKQGIQTLGGFAFSARTSKAWKLGADFSNSHHEYLRRAALVNQYTRSWRPIRLAGHI